MATIPVFACRRCGKAVAVTLESYHDKNAERLKQMMQGLAEIAMCPACRRAYNWFASQGRSDEFLLSPDPVLYTVVDVSDADYYGRKMK